MKTIKLTDKKGLTNTFEFEEMPTITIDGEVVPFESKKMEFKKGDVVTCKYEYKKAIAILNSDYNGGYANATIMLGYAGIDLVSGQFEAHNPKYATQSEAQQLFDALAKDGKQWNAEKLCIEDLKVEPKVGDLVKVTYKTFEQQIVFLKIQSKYRNISESLNHVKNNKEVHRNGSFSLQDSIEILAPDQFQSEVNALGFEYDFENDSYSVLKWKPKEMEVYFYFEESFYINSTWYENSNIQDFARVNVGNCFKTEQECQAKIEQIKNILK